MVSFRAAVYHLPVYESDVAKAAVHVFSTGASSACAGDVDGWEDALPC